MTAMQSLALERTSGELALSFMRRDGKTVAVETFQAGALRVRFPRSYGGAAEAVLINTAGGLTGGDRLTMRLTAGAGTRALICGQACEKIYKSQAGPATIAADIVVEADGEFVWLPQPSILFDRARLTRMTTVRVAPEARLLALEAVILGRTAMQEEFTQGALHDRWRVSRGGELIFADAQRIKGRDAALRARPWALGGARAFATLLYASAGAERRLDEMRSCMSGVRGQAAATAWGGLMIARFAARDGHALMNDIAEVVAAFRQAPMPRMWAI